MDRNSVAEGSTAGILAISLLSIPEFREAGSSESWFEFRERCREETAVFRLGTNCLAVLGDGVGRHGSGCISLYCILKTRFTTQGRYSLDSTRQRVIAERLRLNHSTIACLHD